MSERYFYELSSPTETTYNAVDKHIDCDKLPEILGCFFFFGGNITEFS